MSLIACNECGKEFSSTAKYCPHCGARNSGRDIKVLLFIIGFIVFAIIVFSIGGPSKEERAILDTERAKELERLELSIELIKDSGLIKRYNPGEGDVYIDRGYWDSMSLREKEMVATTIAKHTSYTRGMFTRPWVNLLDHHTGQRIVHYDTRTGFQY